MIRLIRIGAQIIAGNDDFAFYDTVVDRFVRIGGETVFSSIEGLIDGLDCDRTALGTAFEDRLISLARSAVPPLLENEPDPD